jgi:hypothetical protein
MPVEWASAFFRDVDHAWARGPKLERFHANDAAVVAAMIERGISNSEIRIQIGTFLQGLVTRPADFGRHSES